MWVVYFFTTIIFDSTPTLNFAYGGGADFRGKHNEYFNILTTRGLSLTMKTRDVTTFLPRPSLLKSSFLTEAHFVIKNFECNEFVNVSMYANETGYRVYKNFSYTRLGNDKNTLGEWKDTQLPNLRVLSKKVSNLVRANGWEFNVSRVLIDFPLHGETDNWRYNVHIAPLWGTYYSSRYGTANLECPHGLLGQSFDMNKVSLEGSKTNYDKVQIDQKEQAEGSICGTWNDYMVSTKFETQFKYSRFTDDITCHRRDLVGIVYHNSTMNNPIAFINDDLGKLDYNGKIQ